jgi:hypothetical protein
VERVRDQLLGVREKKSASSIPAAAFAAGDDPGDPVERVAYAAELLAKLVVERQNAIRALISVSIARSTGRQVRPATASPSSIRR